MKYFIMILFSFQLSTVFAQNISVKPSDGLVSIQLDSVDYLIQKDTVNGVITIIFTPTTQVVKELESTLGSISTEITTNETEIEELQQRKKRITS